MSLTRRFMIDLLRYEGRTNYIQKNEETMQQQLLTVVNQPVTVDDVRNAAAAMMVECKDLIYDPAKDAYSTWDAIIKAGRSYMVGEQYPMGSFLKCYSRPITHSWRKLAYQFAMQNPDKYLVVRSQSHYWEIKRRGEFVQFNLPHQDYGGEKTYVTCDGQTWVEVNED